MNELLFSAASLTAVIAWIGLAAAAILRAGRVRAHLLLIAGRWVPGALCLLYVVVLVQNWSSAPGGGFGSLEAVRTLFSVSGKALGGWLHFLAFDLLIARSLVDDALSDSRSRWPRLPALPTTFMFGPAGVLVYLGLRWVVSAKTAAPRTSC